MATIRKFEDLEVWKIARELCKFVNRMSLKERFSRDFSLKDQIRRSSGSTMDNIAEGFGRCGTHELIQFLSIANGSACEVKSQLFRALDIEYITKAEFDEGLKVVEELTNKLVSFMNYLKKTCLKGEKYKKPVNSNV